MTTKQPATPIRNTDPGADRVASPSRLRVLAMSAAIAGLTATGGLAVIVSSSAGPTGATAAGTTTGLTGTAGTAPVTAAPTTTTSTSTPAANTVVPQGPGGQPPAGAAGPGHATSGGS
jgi:hypothetical protein